MEGRKACTSIPTSRRQCEFVAEEMIIREIRKVEMDYSYYMKEQKRSVV
ncbi:hypothetical protein CsSME_00005303 [Camellia sinensis var. sinensis]